ncbi:Uncharacterized conserved protein, DUF58 family, contains vWF domain [Clostridium cavendishii DSM 21758]|uniref:Uncharacterized conserved protein, DUF58 family, contains vWF domain n=1 Tax=Clostridium cavendishii DSM 21758 TaxID=1121302 RepID=A0A1M6TT36_9CLOT|nr:DUF58 domain-containing protein [Clostridium cavendishii]SHK60175.1 Uncharacterized conserved protein, DUF58 family, contains vWF domain [Clostridium cavendishii DSM 21758]
MWSVVIALIAMFVIVFASDKIRENAVDNITIKRELDKRAIFKDDSLMVTLKIENASKIPVEFLHIEEQFDKNIIKIKSILDGKPIGNCNYYATNLSINGRERVKRKYYITALKRGAYIISNITIEVGDIFGIKENKKCIEDFKEFLVYPEIRNLKQLSIASNSLLGANLVKRLINEDTLITKGLRDYTTNDRMKDIHWNSSLKLNKLMVREYDFTSDIDAIFILNVQCSEIFWNSIDEEVVEKGVSLMCSLALQTIEQSIPVELWTNASIRSYTGNFKGNVRCNKGQANKILEFGARIDNLPYCGFNDYLKEKLKNFRSNSVYVILTSYINSEIENIIINLTKRGYIIKLIDLSKDQALNIAYIEKISYSWEENYEQ